MTPERNDRWRYSWVTFGGIGAVLGFITWGNLGLFPFLLLFAVGYGYATGKIARAAFVFGYFLGGSEVVVGVVQAFWPHATPLLGDCAWPAIALLLSLPWWLIGWIGPEKPQYLGLRMAASLIITSVPPLSTWSLLSPLFLAGVYFPGTGLAGLILGLVTLSLLSAFSAHIAASRRAYQITMHYLPNKHTPSDPLHPNTAKLLAGFLLSILVTAILLNGTYTPPAQPANIRGVSLPWKALPFNLGFLKNLERQNHIRQWAQQYLKTIPKHQIVILPEGIGGYYFPNFYTAGLLNGIQRIAKARQDTLLVGFYDISQSGKRWSYTDALNAYGLHRGIFPSRQPCPLSEWKPWANGSAQAFWWRLGPDYLGHQKQPFAMAVCYSELLVWPLASYFIEAPRQPEWILAPENHDWEKTAAENAIQTKARRIWGRLYGLPVVTANDFPLGA